MLERTPTATSRKAAEALAELCRTYWRPVFSYVCRRGYSTEDAQDITQDFFLMILETNWLRQADQGRGRFRSLLLKSAPEFSSQRRRYRIKRSSGAGVFNSFPGMPGWQKRPRNYRSRLARSTRSHPSGFSIFAGLRRSWSRRSGVCERSVKAKDVFGFLKALRDYLAAEHGDISYANLGCRVRYCGDGSEKATI